MAGSNKVEISAVIPVFYEEENLTVSTISQEKRNLSY
jgi:hypothetical protein